MKTGFEHLEALLANTAGEDYGTIQVSIIREAMIKDWHLLFHDSAWSDGCPICDKERASE